MPRKAPTEVIEQRFSLSNFERTEFKQTLDAQQQIAQIQAVSSGVKSAAMLVGAGAVGVTAYALWWWLGQLKNPIDLVKDLFVNPLQLKGEDLVQENLTNPYLEMKDLIRQKYLVAAQKYDQILADPNALQVHKELAQHELDKLGRYAREALNANRARFKDDAEAMQDLIETLKIKQWPMLG